MLEGEHDFRLRAGRIEDRGARAPRRARLFVFQVLRAAGRRKPRLAASSGRGRGAVIAAGLRSPARRVVVQARVVRHAGRKTAPLALHLAYLKRDGVDRSGGSGVMFDARGEADERAFAARCEGDRHHFRFMVSPEDAGQLKDLRETIRDLMAQAERDLGTKLDWVAVDHWNTDHPHAHILVRGKDQDGADLVINGGYLGGGLRARAEALVSLELGPRSAREIAAGLDRQAGAEGWTRLDGLLAALAIDGRVDLTSRPGAPTSDMRPYLAARAGQLEAVGLAAAEGAGAWRLKRGFEAELRERALRGDVVKTLHRSLGEARDADGLSFERGSERLVGRLVARGLADEQSGAAYVVVDGADGRAHHVRLRDLEAAGDTPIGGIVEVGPAAEGRAVRVLHRSAQPLERQVLAQGATWLDRQLVARTPVEAAATGFGVEVRAALQVGAEHLETLGLAERKGGRWVFAPGLLAQLRRRELEAVGKRLSEDGGRDVLETKDGPVKGVLRRRLDLASGRFAILEDGLGFRLVPWTRALQRRLGQEVSGVWREGRMAWDLGREKDLSL